MTPRGSKNQSILLRIALTTSHCEYFATVTVTVSNPRTKVIIASVVFPPSSSAQALQAVMLSIGLCGSAVHLVELNRQLRIPPARR